MEINYRIEKEGTVNINPVTLAREFLDEYTAEDIDKHLKSFIMDEIKYQMGMDDYYDANLDENDIDKFYNTVETIILEIASK